MVGSVETEVRHHSPRSLLRRPSRRTLLVGAWLVLVWAVGAPAPLIVFTPTVDGSWMAGLDLAARQHLVSGTDVVFPYGPLGYLANPVFFHFGQWLQSAAAVVAAHVMLSVAVAGLLYSREAPWPLWFVSGGALVDPIFSSLFADGETVVLGPLVLFLALQANRRRNGAALTLIGVLLLAMLALVKEASLFWAAMTVALFAVLAVTRQRSRLAAVGVGGFGVGLLGWWTVAGQPVGALLAYIHADWEVTTGYVGAMGVAASSWIPLVTGVILGTGLAIATALDARARRWSLVHLQLLLLPVLVLAWKDDFIRSGPERTSRFFAVAGVALCLVLVEAWHVHRPERSRVRGAAAVLALLVSAGFVGSANFVQPLMPGLADKPREYLHALRVVLDPQVRADQVAAVRLQIRLGYQLSPAAIASLQSGSVDMVPWDVEVADGYGLRWSPRPVLQSYAGYTAYLDGLDAAHFASGIGADHILYSLEAIDDRYGPFDEPALFRELIAHYHSEVVSGSYLVLGKRSPATLGVRDDGTVCAGLGQTIAVPAEGGRLVFGRVALGYSLSGDAWRLAYEPAEVRISLITGGVVHGPFRLITATAADGIFLSSYLGDVGAARDLFAGTIDRPITAVVISSDSPGQYQPPVCVTFQSAPAPTPS